MFILCHCGQSILIAYFVIRFPCTIVSFPDYYFQWSGNETTVLYLTKTLYPNGICGPVNGGVCGWGVCGWGGCGWGGYGWGGGKLAGGGTAGGGADG